MSGVRLQPWQELDSRLQGTATRGHAGPNGRKGLRGPGDRGARILSPPVEPGLWLSASEGLSEALPRSTSPLLPVGEPGAEGADRGAGRFLASLSRARQTCEVLVLRPRPRTLAGPASDWRGQSVLLTAVAGGAETCA